MRKLWLVIAVCWFPIVALSCAPPPPNLSPAGRLAWKQHELQKDFDLVRDLAQDAAAQTPPVISVASARVVTIWHQSAIQVIHDLPAGWKQTLLDGLMALKNLPASDYAKIQIYVTAAQAALKEYQ